jgi:hypothetical protein
VAVAACASTLRPKEPFSEAALFADDRGYVAHRYADDVLSAELRTDLSAAGYVCDPIASGGHICVRSIVATPGCADVRTVRVTPPDVSATQQRRCTGVVAPP